MLRAMGVGMGVASAGVAGRAVSASAPRGPLGLSQQLIVGPGGDFADVSDALDSITDNSRDKPYQVLLLPGTYGAFATKEYVDVVGSGVKSSIVETSPRGGEFIEIGSNVCIANLGIRFSGSAVSGSVRGAIQKQQGSITEVILKDIEIEVRDIGGVSAPRYAVNFGGKVDLTAWNLRIATESCGLRLASGQTRWHNCDIYLTGNGVGLPHYGVHLEQGNRFDFYGGRIGTGYYYDQDLNDPDQDVVCVYIPASNTEGNSRAEIHDAEMFARNVSPAPNVNVNAVRAENGWARLFGCFCQAEIEPDVNSNGSKSLYAAYRTAAQPELGQGGRIEIYGCRIRSAEGYIVGGAGALGSFTYSTASNGTLIQRYENLCLCDAAEGPFMLKLANDDPPTDGDEHVFKKIDTTVNRVVIDGNGSDIDGAPRAVLRVPYETLRVRRVGAAWYKL